MPHDFDGDHARKLRNLDAELTLAQHAQASAEAVSAVLADRLQAFQTAATAAEAAARQAAADLNNAHTTTQSVAHAAPQAKDASAQAEEAAGKIALLLPKAHKAAQAMIDAAQKIDALATIVGGKKGKNDVSRENVVSGSLQAQINAGKALAAVTTALRDTILAHGAAAKARHAAGEFIESNARLRRLLAPEESANFSGQRPSSGSLWKDPKPRLDSIQDLVRHVEGRSMLEVVDAIATVTGRNAAEQHSALINVSLELNASKDRLSRCNARVASATAAYAAAEAAVA